MKNVNDRLLVIAVAFFLLALFVVRASAQQFEYKGVYGVETILTNYCEDCFLELPPDYLKSEVVLSVRTDNEQTFIKALQASSRAIGWNVTRSRSGRLKAEPNENVGNMVFISCMDNNPRNVPKYLYAASVKSDRLQCAQRDSLQAVARQRAVNDSIRLDSMSRARLDFKGYQLRYFSYNKSFTDRIGVEWGSLLASGNLHNRLDLFDDWRFFANQQNDTTFNERSVVFSVDSTISLDWGSEEQTLKKTFVNDGVTTSDYEWRKYGLLISVKRDGKRVRMDYVFRDKDNSVSVLQGSVIGNEGDTLRLFGNYNTTRSVVVGVPVISTIPLLGELFKSTQSIIDNRAFELYLLPQKQAVEDVKRENSGIVQATGKTATDSTGTQANAQRDTLVQ